MTTGLFASFLPSRRVLRGAFAACVIALAGGLAVATTADARMGGGGSFGSRGSRTYSAPPSTSTAPSASPFQRSATPNGGFTNPGMGAARPGGLFGGGGMLGGGFGRGLLGGFLGAGLFGMLFGHGLTGGLGGGMSLIGLILQLGLLYLAFRFIMGFFANRRQAAGSGGNSSFFGQPPLSGGAPGGMPSGGMASGSTASSFGGGSQSSQPTGIPITIGPEDYQAFEQRLTESQTAYSNGDLSTLRRLATPEMAGNFEQELRENEGQGVVNRISDVRLLNGDLAEAWNENGSDYATVAMHFSLVDATVEKSSGRVVAGDANRPQEVTEIWTFRRPSGGGAQGWTLSGIQQS